MAAIMEHSVMIKFAICSNNLQDQFVSVQKLGNIFIFILKIIFS